MTNSQKFGIFFVLCALSYALWTIGKYWLADVWYANGQKNYQFYVKTQDPQYLVTSFNAFQSASKINPREPAILSEYAVAAAYLSPAVATKDTAIAAANRAITLSPHHPNYYKSAARAYILLSEIDPRYLQLAADTLQKATIISPTDPRLPYNLGIIYKYLNATDSARLQFQKSLQLKPDFSDAEKALKEMVK